jgi:hypothetical protein
MHFTIEIRRSGFVALGRNDRLDPQVTAGVGDCTSALSFVTSDCLAAILFSMKAQHAVSQQATKFGRLMSLAWSRGPGKLCSIAIGQQM